MNRILYILMLLIIVINSCTKDENIEVSANFDVSCKTEFQNIIYPSMIFGLTEFEKQSGETVDYFSITVEPNIKADIRVVIEETKLNFETIITETGVSGSKTIIPAIKWKYDELKKLSQPGNIDLTFVCYNKETEIGRKTLKLGYRSINECVYAAKINNEFQSFHFMYAGYINEDSPVIDGFLQEVLQETILNGFVGYQWGEREVIKQVGACFLTLRIKGLKYSSITNTSNTNPNIYSQYVRFADEVLNNTQANCADGTVFLCSVLKKIGIHTEMIFIPGHVYLGFYSDDAKTTKYLLETTAVGNISMTVEDAFITNVDSYNANISKFYNDDFSDGYFIIDVDNARSLIKPIGRK